MPARQKTAASPTRAVRPVKATTQPTGTFARIKAEADKQRLDEQGPPAPYVIDDVDPPIVIQPPEDTERQLELAEMFDAGTGAFRAADARRILTLICGDEFDRVWDMVRHEHITVLMALIDDMGTHFENQANLREAAGEFPGGSAASSS